MADLPKVVPKENADGVNLLFYCGFKSQKSLVLEGLSVQKVEDVDQALDFFLIGNANRTTCETPNKDASTRSHCVFTVEIQGGSISSNEGKASAKLHIVELSGSES